MDEGRVKLEFFYYLAVADAHFFQLQHIPDEAERLGEALLQVDADGRDLLLLAYCLDLSDREIGLLLGTSRSTIQRRRQRFLDQMKQLLKE